MKRKLLFPIVLCVFAGLTVFNVGLAHRSNNTDTTLDLISVMAKAYDEGEGGATGSCSSNPDDPNWATWSKKHSEVVRDQIVTASCGFNGWIARVPVGSTIDIYHGTGVVGHNINCPWSPFNKCCTLDVGFYPI